eukprot:TRINITY_DN30719_c0_g1_i1.p1 TRINITY_DN30719_c0_g1~~TRINITY_DN30719_c0_g1_i1.p1  ORF type:complete len:700 (+),score=172.87 TRINITY_DN30719_c0_g1_i1:223-2100(+)
MAARLREKKAAAEDSKYRPKVGADGLEEVDVLSLSRTALVQQLMRAGRLSTDAAALIAKRVMTPPPTPAPPPPPAGRGRGPASAQPAGTPQRGKIMSAEEMRAEMFAMGKAAAAARAKGDWTAYGRIRHGVRVMADALKASKERDALGWSEQPAEEGVDDWAHEYIVVPPAGSDSVALRKSPSMNDRASVAPLPRGLRVDAVVHSEGWLRVKGDLYLPAKFAKEAGQSPPTTPAPTEPTPAYGQPQKGYACKRPARSFSLTEEKVAPDGRQWAQVKLPEVDMPPGSSTAARLWAQRCALFCSDALSIRCKRFTTYASARCELVTDYCSLVASHKDGPVTYQQVTTTEEAHSTPPPTPLPPALTPAPRRLVRPAPLQRGNAGSVREHIAFLEQEKQQAKRDDDLVLAMDLRKRISDLRKLLRTASDGPSFTRRGLASRRRSDTEVAAIVQAALDDDTAAKPAATTEERVVFIGAGCFWGVRKALMSAGVDGITGMSVGWMGGFVDFPTAELVAKGITGHAEVVRVAFADAGGPAGPVFQALLKAFWLLHNPFEKGRQGADVGSQFRSALFYTDAAQGSLILPELRRRQSDKTYNPRRQRVQTEVAAAGSFWPAPYDMKEHCRGSRG